MLAHRATLKTRSAKNVGPFVRVPIMGASTTEMTERKMRNTHHSVSSMAIGLFEYETQTQAGATIVLTTRKLVHVFANQKLLLAND